MRDFCLLTHKSAANQSACPIVGPAYHGLASGARSTTSRQLAIGYWLLAISYWFFACSASPMAL